MRKERKSRQVTRRDFIKTSTAAAIGFNIIGCGRMARKPNLLFIWTDQQRADTMQVYGNAKIHAPNLNKLADESVVFENAYVSQPVCTPSRSTVMTGFWPHQSGCTENNVPLPEDFMCLPEMLNDPDYRTGYYGKWHLGDELWPQHGFEEWASIEDVYFQYFRPGRDKTARSDYHHWLVEKGYVPDNKTEARFERETASRMPFEHCKPKFLEERAIDFLKRNRKNPFLLTLNFLEPHPPIMGPMDDVHDLQSVDLPPNFDDPLDEDEPQAYRKKIEKIYRNGHKQFKLRTEAGWRRMIANYWGLVTQVDKSVGSILNALEDLGLADNTIVGYTSDHGDMMGSHRLVAKGMMFEEACRVPWLMRIPDYGRHQNIVRGRFSHIDLIPTVMDVMGLKHRPDLPGKSLVSVIKGDTSHERPVMIEWSPQVKVIKASGVLVDMNFSRDPCATKGNIRTVITQEGWKLCWSDHDKNQLYNLKDDPYETTNLYYRGQHEDIIRKLKHIILNWQEETEDRAEIASNRA